MGLSLPTWDLIYQQKGLFFSFFNSVFQLCPCGYMYYIQYYAVAIDVRDVLDSMVNLHLKFLHKLDLLLSGCKKNVRICYTKNLLEM